MRSSSLRLSRYLFLAAPACATAAPTSTPSEAAPGPAAANREALPFIEDDYPRALAEARARHVPLFVDAWATWCHSCLYLKSYVFTDPALAKHAAEFVWLSVDTDKPQNAAFQAHYPIEAWPTLFVIDPAREVATFKWLGTANAPDLERLLADARRELEPAAGTGTAAAALAQADVLEAADDHAHSAPLYRQALAGELPAADRDRALVSLLGSLQMGRDYPACVQLAREKSDAATDATVAAGLTVSGLQCALDLDEKDPLRAAALPPLEATARRLLPAPGLNGDDRSSLYEVLSDERQAQGDAAGAKELAGQWLAFLQGEAAKASTAEARAVYDPHLVNAAIALGDAARALPALERSERELPADYNPPARLALLHAELGRFPEALADTDRALAKVYGPRTLRVLETRAAVFAKMGDLPHQKEALDRAVAFAAALPVGQRAEKTVARLQAARAKLGP